jgi:hypothetical protein
VPANLKVEVVVIEEILSHARHRRAQHVCHCEQKNACRGLPLFRVHPLQNAFEPVLAFQEEQVNDH